ncbi:MAG: Gfo/Idh/MocA family oxidoreductase [Acidimicrobiia bacterium]|nr:Gfo/Idh/MocA family oxidoreductase [Acidimicrobiia bacterium]
MEQSVWETGEETDMRFGLIGAGRIGAFHGRTLAAHAEVDAVVVTDPLPERARAVADDIGGKVAPDAESMIGTIDAMIVAAATDAHAPMMHLSADAGIPVFCEKPIAVDLPTTDAAVAHIRESGIPAQIGFQRRFDAGYVAAKKLVDDGSLGHLYLVRTNTHDYEPPPPGYVDMGIFVDTQIHDFDILRFVTGQEAVEVFATGFTTTAESFGDDRPIETGVVILSLSDGTQAMMSGVRHDPVGHDVRMELFGVGDSVSVGLARDLPLRSVEPGGPVIEEPTPKSFLDRFASAYTAEIEAFIDVAQGRAASPCTPEDAREALRIAIACNVSRAEHRPVRLEEIE